MLVAQVPILLESFVDDVFELAGVAGFRRAGGTGSRLRIESKIRAEVSPRNGSDPVAIS